MTDSKRPACRDHDPELWFADPSDVASTEEAKRICLACPLRTACLQAALDFETSESGKYRYGIWGGTTPYDRAGKPNPTTRWKRSVCGTDSGYYKHRRTYGDSPCDACSNAHREAEKARRVRKRAASVESPVLTPALGTIGVQQNGPDGASTPLPGPTGSTTWMRGSAPRGL